MSSASATANASRAGFWGPPTATIDWCEPNYQHSFYVAEFWNTLSNLLFVLLGLYGLRQSMKQGFEPRFHVQFIGVIVTGLGSAMFHGTLQSVHQQCDETPMVWAMLVCNEINQLNIPKSTVVAVLTFLGVAFAVVHAIYRFTTFFQLAFGTLAVLCCVRLCFFYSSVQDPRAKAVARSYVRNSLIGFAFWMIDYHYCHHMRELPVNPQGHAWWHIFMGISSYHGPVFMQYVRMEQLKQKGEVQDACFGIQTIVIHDLNPDTAATKKPKSL
ncbi:Alkaline phytoceramidase, partial [Globisporangium splendens]